MGSEVTTFGPNSKLFRAELKPCKELQKHFSNLGIWTNGKILIQGRHNGEAVVKYGGGQRCGWPGRKILRGSQAVLPGELSMQLFALLLPTV